jgi:(p)ppGpp synthase/HD superfamily hydrolase
MIEIVKKARDFAIKKHGSQMYGENPYVYHLDKVYEVILSAGLGVDYQVAAYLHDCLEDTNTTKEELLILFNENVVNLVYSVTGEGENRKERKQSMLNKLNDFNDGISLKMADRLVNILESKSTNAKLYEMYKKEHNDYKDLFDLGNDYLKCALNKSITEKNKLKL